MIKVKIKYCCNSLFSTLLSSPIPNLEANERFLFGKSQVLIWSHQNYELWENVSCSLQLLTSILDVTALHCNCNHTLFTKLPWARRQRRDLSVFESSFHLPTCQPHTEEASRCPFNCWTPSWEAVKTNFIVFGLTKSGIEPESTVSVADALSTRSLID